MYQTEDKTIYLGITDGGLKKLKADGSDLESVDTTDVGSGFMYQTQDNTIYVGTSEKGLKKLLYTVKLTPN